jgi:beta-galactosidase
VHYYRGPSWYRTNINISNPYNNGRTILHFEGAGQKTKVYVYNQLVGEHVGGYDEFSIDITSAVDSFKQNTVFEKQFKGLIPVIVRVDNSPDAEMIPSGLSDFNVYGGIYRYLNLQYHPSMSIEKLFIKPVVDEAGKMGSMQINARMYDPLQLRKSSVSIQVKDPNGKEIHRQSLNISTSLNDPLLTTLQVKSPEVWSPADPKLYSVVVEVNDGVNKTRKEEKVGFRNFRFETHGPFFLNGKRLLLRGTHRHEDHAGVGAAMTEEMIRQEMIMIKDMGANFIRLGHYQQSSIVLNLCDSLGLLVWEEIPWCRGGLGGSAYQAQAKRMLTNMIEQHYNHPAIIFWGLGNENDWPGDFARFDKEAIRKFMSELNDLSHRLDPSRKTSIRRCEFCKDIVDVYAPSIWAGWYHGDYSKYRSMAEKANQSVDHFFHAEWGGDSHAGRHREEIDELLLHGITASNSKVHGGDEATVASAELNQSKDGDWSESYMVNLFDWHLKEQENMPWLTGAAQWVFKDFSTPVRPENPVPYMNQKGVVERDFTKKESYYVFKSYWTEKPMIHIYGHSWPVRWGEESDEKLVKVYSNCETVNLTVNGKSYGEKKRNSQDFPAAGLRWEVNFKKGDNIIIASGKKTGISIADTVYVQYQTEQWDTPSHFTLEKIDEADGITTLEAKTFDKNEVLCLDASMFVSFGITGTGILLDDLGTSDGSRKIQLRNGRARIKIKTQKGRSVISVVSDGMPPAFLPL